MPTLQKHKPADCTFGERTREGEGSVTRRSSWARVVLVGAILGLAFVPVVSAPLGTRSLTASTLKVRLDRFIALGVPGAVARVRLSNGASLTATAGKARLGNARAVDSSDAWRIASVTKLVTAAVVLQLAREGRISLDDNASRYLGSRVVRHAETITLRQLLNHTSGVPDYLKAPDFPWQISAKAVMAHRLDQTSPRLRISQADALPRSFLPGTRHDYSNTNYLLLGLIAEVVTGKPFEALVQERVIEPLGLMHTGFPDAKGRIGIPHLGATIASDGPGGPFADAGHPIDVSDHALLPAADGGLYSNASDLAAIVDALVSGLLAKGGREAFVDMTREAAPSPDGDYEYGLGVMVIRTRCGVTVYGHEGQDLGAYTLAFGEARPGGRALVLGLNASIELTPKLEREADSLMDAVFCPKEKDR